MTKSIKKVLIYRTLYFKNFVNYFIMYDIKYFFSIKTIKQFRKTTWGRLPKSLPKSTNFQNLKSSSPLPELC
jgi:hypothetical protein